jgi:L-amino acid N-acyltransferase YncA
MSDFDIRPADAGDIPAITRIYADAVLRTTATLEIEPPSDSEMARRQQNLLANGFPYYVATQNGAVAAYAYAGPYHARPGYRWTVEDSVYVDPQFHRRGLGHLLVTRLVAEAEARGFRQMIAVIGGTQQASVALHATLGFTLIGTLRSVGFKLGRWIDVVLMQRPLGDSDSSAP